MRFAYTDGRNQDFVLLCGLLDESLDELAGNHEARKQYVQYNQLDHIHDVIVVYIDDKPVACGSFKEYEDGVVEIKRVFVDKAHRGKGISKELMRRLEESAAGKGYTRAILETGRHHEAAVGLYHCIGYVEIENYGQYKDMPKSICFEKILTAL